MEPGKRKPPKPQTCDAWKRNISLWSLMKMI